MKSHIRWVFWILAAVCFFIAFHLKHPTWLFPSAFSNPRWYGEMSLDETRLFDQIHKLYKENNKQAVLDLVGIKGEEVDFSVIPAKLIFTADEPKLGVIRIENKSPRRLILFAPTLQKLTLESYKFEGHLQDDVMVDCSPSEKHPCHILVPSQTLFFPILLPAEGKGQHKLNFSFMTPTSTGQQTIRRSSPTFEITP